MIGVLIRDQVYSTCILGTLYINEEIFYTLERPWSNNARNKSCIPQGVYNVRTLPRSASGRYRDVFHILDVKDRSGILIHNGNVVNHSLGCVLVGKKKGMLGNKHAVLSSKLALRKLNRVVNKNNFKLHVIGGY